MIIAALILERGVLLGGREGPYLNYLIKCLMEYVQVKRR